MSFRTKFWLIIAVAVAAGWATFFLAIYPNPEPIDERLEDFAILTQSNDLWHQGVRLHMSEQPEKAMVSYNRSLEINPESIFALLYRGKLHYDNQDYPAAIEDFTTAINFDPMFGSAINARAVARFRNSDRQGAFADIERALKNNPDFPLPYLNHGIMLRLDGDLDAASDMFDRLETATEGKEVPKLLENRAMILFSRGDLEGALELYDQFIEAYPDKADAYAVRAEFHKALGNTTKAQKDMKTFDKYETMRLREIAELRSNLKQGN